MQSEDNQHLRDEVDNLTREIANEKDDYERQINALRMERSQLEEYSRQDYLADQERIDELLGKINDTNEFSMATFKDHAQLIRDSD